MCWGIGGALLVLSFSLGHGMLRFPAWLLLPKGPQRCFFCLAFATPLWATSVRNAARTGYLNGVRHVLIVHHTAERPAKYAPANSNVRHDEMAIVENVRSVTVFPANLGK